MNSKAPKNPPHLEWHGKQWRVVFVVPRSQRAVVGKTKIKVGLGTGDIREAERLKHGVLAKLRREIDGVRPSVESKIEQAIQRALLWKEAITEDPSARDVLIDTEIERLIDKGRHNEAATFLAVADGQATPFKHLVDSWVRSNLYTGRTEEKARHSIGTFIGWCEKFNVATTFEAIDRKVTARFVQDVFIDPKKNATTANTCISWVTRFWKWAKEADIFTGQTPWEGRRISKELGRRIADESGKGSASEKIPFSDEDMRVLLGGSEGHLNDVIRFAALTGMRLGEIANLKVADVSRGWIRIRDGKNENADRDIPVHSDLTDLVAIRSEGKGPAVFLFSDLRGQERAKALSKLFTRFRRKLGVGVRMKNSQQDDRDFHSLRRWFIDKALHRLAYPDAGYTAWTIADVVGHDNEDGPLPMTTGRYPGRAPEEQLRSCVQAVSLPV